VALFIVLPLFTLLHFFFIRHCYLIKVVIISNFE
jgi:hypothetical protein